MMAALMPLLHPTRSRPGRGTDVVVGHTDDASLSALVEHRAALLRYAMRLTAGDRGRAEDIVQETLLRAWRAPEMHDDTRGSIRPWLFTVAKRIAIDAHRARQARPQEVDDGLLAVIPAADEVDAQLDRLLILDALRAISEDHRAVIVELYYGGRSVPEAALRLGIPAGTVKSRAYYGLRALKLALVERGALS